MPKTGKQRVAAAVMLLLAVTFPGAGCSSMPPAQWGKLLKYGNAGSLYYSASVTEEEARSLADYLSKLDSIQDEPPVFRLTKEKNVYQVRSVSAKEVLEKQRLPEEMGPVEAAALLAGDISRKVFNGAKVEWHFCDNAFNTLRVAGD